MSADSRELVISQLMNSFVSSLVADQLTRLLERKSCANVRSKYDLIDRNLDSETKEQGFASLKFKV